MPIHPVFIQAAIYGGVMIVTYLLLAILLKGFLFSYLRVRMSFGRFVLVKVRTVMRDYFKIGKVENDFLIYKNIKGDEVNLAIPPNEKVFYRSIGVDWIDIDEAKNALAKTDYSAVTGFDSAKFSDLLTRALQRPTVSSGKEKVIIVLILLCLVLAAAAAYLGYMNYTNMQALRASLPGMFSSIAQKATVVASNTAI